MVVLLMGVSGSGKTTVGTRLAEALGWTFADGDDFHPASNVEKMRRGTPLTDADRWPWLRALQDYIGECLADDVPAVVACSALKAAYREVLLEDNPGAELVYLRGSYRLIRRRMEARPDHFFDAEMLDSQFEALEEPAPDEALIVDVDAPPSAIVEAIRRRLPGLPSPAG
ncbi:MAG: gluconokinase [Salinibacter sp.]